jgi:hypothetical protein
MDNVHVTSTDRYGIPYFKDTTPSWSTRGKLRTQLLPLLADMYGVGCLNNIASLAKESDEAKQLVHCSVYKPFLDSVLNFPAGLIVHVMAHKNQPMSFWREMLKELMHSMSMSMVREKAVMNFVERLQRDVPRVNIWLELRKGFNTFLDDRGDLLIFRDQVLRIQGGYRQSTKQGGLKEDSKLEAELELLAVEEDMNSGEELENISLACGEHVLIDSWQISCDVFDSTDASWEALLLEARGASLLPSPRLLLERAQFSYLLCLSQGAEERGRVHLHRHQSSSRPPIAVTALHGVDSKLRLGLPFLVPSPSVYAPLQSKEVPKTVARLRYTYIQPPP